MDTVKIFGFVTKAYRVALVVVGVVGLVLPQVNGIDFSNPTSWISLAIIIIAAFRQIQDPTSTPISSPPAP